MYMFAEIKKKYIFQNAFKTRNSLLGDIETKSGKKIKR